MDTKQSKLRPYNQLIEQLKSEGLYLTEQKKIKLPLCLSPPPSIATRLVSLLSNQKKKFSSDAEKRIWTMQQNFLLITQSNTLSSYILEIKNNGIDLQQKQKFHLDQNISAVTFSHSKTSNDTKSINFLVTYQKSNMVSLFSIKNKQTFQINLQSHLKAKSNVLTLSFISKSQFLIITSKHIIFHYKIEKSSIKAIREINCIQNLTGKNQSIIFIKMLARPKEEQDSLIAIFYATWNSQTQKCELKIKEMYRQLDGNIYITDPVYQIFSFTQFESTKQKKEKSKQTNFYQKSDFQQVEVINQRQYFLLKLHHEIFVITKHFDKYVRLDAITQNFTSFKILMIQHHVPLICCIGSDSMELWHVTIQSKKSKCTLMDVINLNPKFKLKESQFIRFWVINYNNKPETLFAFDRGGRQIGIFGVKRVDKVTKLVNRITNSNGKAQILKVQQLGKKLGVQKKSLYLKLWHDNPQTPANIYLYLLKSNDLPSIHLQLEKYMRKKFILTGQLIKIHTQIENMLLQKLKQDLSFHNLKWFLKTNFQKRKLKLFSYDTQITFKEFQNIYNSSIFDLIQKNIDKKVFPQKLVSKIPWNQKPVQQPDINVYQILQEFKLLILQNYEEFLLRLLEHYRYNAAEIFQKFPDLLPKFPFKMEVFYNNEALNSELMVSNLLLNSKNCEEASMREISKVREFKEDSNQSYQKYWFSEVTQKQWMGQKSSIDHIFTALYPYYQTHQIMNLLTQLTEGQWNAKKKYVTHCLISTTVNTFRQRVTKIQGIKLYLSVCQFVNRVKFQAQQKLNAQNFARNIVKCISEKTQDFKTIKAQQDQNRQTTLIASLQKNLISQAPRILEIMKEKRVLMGDGYQTCVLFSKMHDLMITKKIMKEQTTIADLMTTSHSSLIAAFFIGERQRNSELFKDFFPLYKDKQLFYDSLSEYIKSPCCSRVQLEILVKELHDLKQDNEEYNNYLAELLIQGFCMRTQIRQKHEAHQIICMFSDIGLKLDLAFKMQKFIAIQKQLVFIFELFMCDKLTYQQVLDNPKKVVSLMMENYFNSNLNWGVLKNQSSVVVIESKQIDLDIVGNTFSILLYLKEKIYVQMSQMELSLLFGEIMIEWEQFDVLRTIFSQQGQIPSESQFTSTEYFEKLIVNVLNQIYTKQNIYMDDQTISYIQNILSLLEEKNLNPLIVRERTKLQLSKLLQKWGYTIQSVTVQLICIKWKEQNRQELIIQIMDNCIQYFDLEALQTLYRLLETTRLGTTVRDIRNTQSIRLAYRLAQKLVVFAAANKNTQITNKEEEISKIIYFINKNSSHYVAEMGLMAQTFLKIVMKKYSQDPFILQAQLRSDYPDQKKNYQPYEQSINPYSPFLAVRKPSISKLHKSFDIPQNSLQNASKSKDKSYYDSKSFYNYGEITRNSGKPRASNIQDPINGANFDDPMILQRILNHFLKFDTQTRKSILYHQITQLKAWHVKGKSIIEHFVLNWQNVQVINQMFRNKFSREISDNNDLKTLTVNRDVTFKLKQSIAYQKSFQRPKDMQWAVNIDLEILWQVAVHVSRLYINHYIKVLKHRSKQFTELLNEKFCKILYYGYFFLLISLKFPSSILNIDTIEYEHIANLFMIAQLESQAKAKIKDLQKINFESIWKSFYDGLKNQIIRTIKLSLPQTKIPDDIQTKTMQRLINNINKQKPTIALNFKILGIIQNYLNKYVKEQKPKVLHQLKNIYESMMMQFNPPETNLLRKRTSHQRGISLEFMKITVKQIQQVKQRIQELSQHSINYDGQGIMKQIAEIFQDFKKVRFSDNEESVKDVILKKILSKRKVNISQFMSEKSEKQISPFESSIVLQNKILNDRGFTSHQIVKDTSFGEKSKSQQKNNSLDIQYFKDQKFQFESFIGLNSEQKRMSDSSDHFLSTQNNVQEILKQSQLPLKHLIDPQDIIKKLASKDSKFENKYHLTHPISQNISAKIKDFAKLLNSFQIYFNKSSKYYLEESIKRMLTFSPENILQIIQQLFYEEDSILITLNPKQLQANNLKRSKGFETLQQKYKKAKFSFILELVKSLKLNSSIIFQDLLEIIKENENMQFAIQKVQKRMNNSPQSVQEQRNSEPITNKYFRKIFPLSDLTSLQTGTNSQEQIQTIFGRVYLCEITLHDDLLREQFQVFIKIIQNLFQKLSQISNIQNQQQKPLKNYSFEQLKDYFSYMMICQIIRQKYSTSQMKKKLEFLLFNISKSFLIQTHQLTQSLLQQNPELHQLFTISVIKILNDKSTSL